LGHPFEQSYDYAQSSTYTRADPPLYSVIPFGIGNLEGHWIKETLSIGDSTGQKVTITNQNIGVVDKSRGIFENPDFEAIVGLAYQSLAYKGIKGVM
jgi:hypothetical protein